METAVAPLLQVENYWSYPDRYSVVDAFWNGHREKDGKFPETVIPPLAIIVTADGKPAAFLACYQAIGIGVAILDWVCTAPGLSLAAAKSALLFGANAIKEALKPHYGLLITYTLPGIARTLRREGWSDAGEKAHLISIIA